MNDLNGNEQIQEAVQEQVVSQPPVSMLAQQDPVLSSETPPGMEDFRKYLPEDMRNHPALANFKDVAGLTKSYLGQMQVVGRRFEDLTPEQLDMFYNKQGRPEAPSGYELPEAQPDDPIVGWYKETAHKLGLTQKAASELYKSFNELSAEQHGKNLSKQVEVADSYEKQLRQEFGPSFDERVQCAQRAAQEFGDDELRQLLSNPMIGNHPAVIRAFSNVGRRLIEHSGVRGQSVQFKLSPDEAATEIKNLNRDPEFLKAYLDHRHPGHKEAFERQRSLYNIAYEGV